MNASKPVTEEFEAHRAHLRSVALRILGSAAEADDAVQEAWLRLCRAETKEVTNLRGWLTTVVARICFDALRARRARREEPLAPDAAERFASAASADDELRLADSMGVALLVVLETLTPAERVAFVLHDVFNLSFEEIAPILQRSLAATRQLASRARRRVQGSPEPAGDHGRQHELVAAFLRASRESDFTALLALLDPQVVLRADPAAIRMNAARQGDGTLKLTAELRGAEAVAGLFKGRARVARPAAIDGVPGLAFAPDGQVRAVLDFVVEGGRIAEINLIAEPAALAVLDISPTS